MKSLFQNIINTIKYIICNFLIKVVNVKHVYLKTVFKCKKNSKLVSIIFQIQISTFIKIIQIYWKESTRIGWNTTNSFIQFEKKHTLLYCLSIFNRYSRQHVDIK